MGVSSKTILKINCRVRRRSLQEIRDQQARLLSQVGIGKRYTERGGSIKADRINQAAHSAMRARGFNLFTKDTTTKVGTGRFANVNG